MMVQHCDSCLLRQGVPPKPTIVRSIHLVRIIDWGSPPTPPPKKKILGKSFPTSHPRDFVRFWETKGEIRVEKGFVFLGGGLDLVWEATPPTHISENFPK